MKNSGTVTSAWLTICKQRALHARSWFSAKIPSVMKPICATDEKPTTRRAFVVENAITEP